MAAIFVYAMNPKRTRCLFTAALKAEVGLAALIERQPLAKLATRYQLSVAQISRWKLHLRQQAAPGFGEHSATAPTPPDVEPLYAAIGRLQLENQLLKNAAAICVAQQRALVQASIAGSVQARCQALGLARSSYYY